MKKNYLRYTTQKTIGTRTAIVRITLDDDCKNGVADWSYTGTIYDGLCIDKNMVCAGCCHEALEEFFPEFKRFADLHLSDWQGIPMYAVENGFYWLKNGENETLKKNLRLSDYELITLCTYAENKEIFAYLLDKMGLYSKWESESNQAIKILEGLVGYSYEDNSVRSHKHPLSDERKEEIAKLFDSGYFSPECIAERKRNEYELSRKLKVEDVMQRFDVKIKKLLKERDVLLYIIEKGLSVDNFIYYDHRNTGVFNWLEYKDKITQEQFVDFVNSIDYSRLPDGIEFELK